MHYFKFGKNSLINRNGIKPELIQLDDLALKLSPVDFGHGPFSGLRTAEEQNKLFLEKKSKADGYKILSNHQSGKALDFYAYVNGEVSYKEDHLAMVACAYFQAASILGYKINWGGLWIPKEPKIVNDIPYGWDCPHIEWAD